MSKVFSGSQNATKMSVASQFVHCVFCGAKNIRKPCPNHSRMSNNYWQFYHHVRVSKQTALVRDNLVLYWLGFVRLHEKLSILGQLMKNCKFIFMMTYQHSEETLLPSERSKESNQNWTKAHILCQIWVPEGCSYFRAFCLECLPDIQYAARKMQKNSFSTGNCSQFLQKFTKTCPNHHECSTPSTPWFL